MNADENKSLILGSGAQLDLMPGTLLDEAGLPPEAYTEPESRGRFTGERLFLQNPKLYRAIAALLGRALPYREIAEICQVSVNTVCAVVVREKIPIETIREAIGRIGLDVSKLTLEAIRDLLADPENAGKFSIKDLAIVHGIATTNAQLVLGAATSRVETLTASQPEHADYLALMAEVRERTIKNVTPPATGLDADNRQLKEDGERGVIEVNASPSPSEKPSQQQPSTPTK